ncbi:MAG: flagellar filament capping protein FliD [Chloroflexota bacterium]|jgi:flagellar hook-associated protein 2
MINSTSSLLGGGQSSPIENLIAQYMALEQQPINTLKTQRDELNIRSAMFNDLKTKIKELSDLAKELAGIGDEAITAPTTVFDSHTVTTSDSNLATGTASASAANGSYVLDNIVLAKAHRVQSGQLPSNWTAAEDGIIVVNGTRIPISAGDTLNDVRNAINAASYAAGREVIATVINVDGGNSRLILDAKNTGTDYAIKLADLSGSTLSSLAIATTSSSSVAISGISVSTEDPLYPASNLTDGVTGDAASWHGTDAETSWTITLDLGEAQTVSRMVWGRDQGGSEISGTPKKYVLEYLDSDGVTWRTLQSVKDGAPGAGEAKTDTFYAVTTSQIRITITATNDGTPPAIDEIALYNDVGTFSQPALQEAANASLTINGVAVSGKNSNTLTDTVSGITVNLKAEGGPVTLVVAPDTSAMKSKINNFLNKLNSLVDYLRSKSAITKGTDGNYTRGALSGNTLYTGLQADLFEDLLTKVTGLPSNAPSTLSQLGITMDANLHFSISDSSTFERYLETNASGVASLFGGENGIAKKVSERLSPFVEAPSSTAKSYLDLEIESIGAEQKSIDERIATLNERLAMRESSLRQQFARLQAAIIEATQMQQRLQSMFGSGSGWGFMI